MTGTDVADLADSASATTIIPPASGVRQRRGREATADAGAREAYVSTSGSGFRIQREKNFYGVFIEIAIATDL
jgi:hypothetical protein